MEKINEIIEGHVNTPERQAMLTRINWRGINYGRDLI